MRLEYPSANPDERLLSVTTVVDPFSPDDVAQIDSRAFLVTASFRGEAPLALLEAIKAKQAILAVDIQGFVRVVDSNGRLRYDGDWPQRAAVLGLIDVLKTDAIEAEALTGHTDIRTAARALADCGPREIVLTHQHGLLVFAEGVFYESAFTPTVLRGRSGRGDTCIGSYMSKRLNASAREATRWAGAVTTLKLEAEGPIRRTRAEVEALLRE
jgi:sugar/nucleoside kinase (ribokinase family)